MPENTLGMLPANGFYPKSNIKKSAEIYLNYMSENYGYDIWDAFAWFAWNIRWKFKNHINWVVLVAKRIIAFYKILRNTSILWKK